MKIACNYLLETEALVRNNQIQIDYFKYPALGNQMELMKNRTAFANFCGELKKLRPILLHGLYPAPHDLSSSDLIKEFDDTLCGELLSVTQTPGISLHTALSSLRQDVPEEALIDTIISNLHFLKEAYPDMDFLSVENLDGPSFGRLIEPDIVSTIVNESGCQFLLDISHAYCAANALHEDIRQYLKKLPLEKVYEIHINGWIRSGSHIMCHVKIHEQAYALLQEILDCCSPHIITIEYGRSSDRRNAGIPLADNQTVNDRVKAEIIEQVETVQKMIDSV